MPKNLASRDGKACDPLTDRVILVDASVYFFRSLFSPFVQRDAIINDDGYSIATAKAFGRWLIRLLANSNTDMIAVCFDESLGSGFRNDIYAPYKSSREEPCDATIYEMSVCQSICHMLGLSTFASPTHEADDLIATLARVAHDHGHPVTVLSSDKDLFQVLTTKGDLLYDFPQGDPYDRHACFEKLGVWPGQVSDFLALTGDRVDDIPGVPGVGPKSAAKLLSSVYSLDQLYEKDPDAVKRLEDRKCKIASLDDSVEETSNQPRPCLCKTVREKPELESIAEKIVPYTDQLAINCRLTALDSYAPLVVSTDEIDDRRIDHIDSMHYLARGPADLDALEYFCEALSFTLPLGDLPCDLAVIDYDDPAPLRLIKGGLDG